MIKDITNKRFGSLVTVELLPERTKHGDTRYLCKCDCGGECVVKRNNLINGDTKSCGCYRHKSKIEKGARLGKLVVTEQFKNENGRTMTRCRCDCGKEYITKGERLLNGHTKSCGCEKRKSRVKIIDRTYAIKKRLFYERIISRCKKDNLSYDITEEIYIKLIDKPCHYCGVVGSITSKDNHRSVKGDTIVHHNGVDRIDSNKGYLLGNVVPCCFTCNKAKNTMTQQEFKS